MASERVHPDVVRVLWVAHRDVTGHALGEAAAREVAEDSSSMHEDVPAVLSVRGERRYAAHHDWAMTDGFQGSLFRYGFGWREWLFRLALERAEGLGKRFCERRSHDERCNAGYGRVMKAKNRADEAEVEI